MVPEAQARGKDRGGEVTLLPLPCTQGRGGQICDQTVTDMNNALRFLAGVSVLGAVQVASSAAPAAIKFRVQEIDKSLKVGYAVVLTDVNADGKKDVVVCDSNRVIWFDNAGGWKLHTITEGRVKPDNVCIDLYDIDGDKDLDLVLGADWQFNNTKSGGTLQWLEQGPNIDEPWKIHPILNELPTLHRIRFADFNNDGRPELVVAPLKGRGATQEKNLMDAPTQLLLFPIPTDPVKGPWESQVITETLHANHNVHPCVFDDGGPMSLLTASYEGVWLWKPESGGKWSGRHVGAGHQADPNGPRGASELKLGRLKGGRRFIATVEPLHGNYAVIYTEPRGGAGGSDPLWTRTVLDAQIKWGHAVWCADLDGDGGDELILGFRDPLPGIRGPGVNIYRAADPAAETLEWHKQVVEDKGVATEDLACADLDGDGRIDIVAVGRATRNARIYWNEGAGGDAGN